MTLLSLSLCLLLSPQEPESPRIEWQRTLADALAVQQATGKPLLVCCAGGSRSAAACEFLSQQGYAGLHNLEGGMNSWSGPRVRP